MSTTTDDLTALNDEANAFFAELARNDERAWFEPRKERYREGGLRAAMDGMVERPMPIRRVPAGAG